ncbi:hypothetical protein L1O48_07570 [Ligilactobacillus equi]|uniref:hypothetical protein n=1 Tax=Ligilactobacillus equi TaxID=137357 RepID=UPI002ED104FF
MVKENEKVVRKLEKQREKLNTDELNVNDQIVFGQIKHADNVVDDTKVNEEVETNWVTLSRKAPHRVVERKKIKKRTVSLWILLVLLVVMFEAYFFIVKEKIEKATPVSAQVVQKIVVTDFSANQSDLTDKARREDMDKLLTYAKNAPTATKKHKYEQLASAGKQGLQDIKNGQKLKDASGLYRVSASSDALRLKKQLDTSLVKKILPTFYVKRVQFYDDVISRSNALKKLGIEVDKLYNGYGNVKQNVSQGEIKILQKQLDSYQDFKQAKIIKKKLTKASEQLEERNETVETQIDSEIPYNESVSAQTSSQTIQDSTIAGTASQANDGVASYANGSATDNSEVSTSGQVSNNTYYGNNGVSTTSSISR